MGNTGKTLLVAALILWVGYHFCGADKSGPVQVESPPPVTPAEPTPPLKHESLSIVDWSWRAGGYGVIMLADFTIRNDGGESASDIQIKCTMVAPSGTELGAVAVTVYETVRSRQKRTFRGVNMGFISHQAKSARCDIVGTK